MHTCGDHAFPYVIADREWSATPNTHWHKEHVGYNVIQCQTDETSGRKPDRDDLGRNLSGTD